MQHSLSDKTTRKATVLSSWSSQPGVVREKEFIKKIDKEAQSPEETEIEELAGDVISDGDELMPSQEV